MEIKNELKQTCFKCSSESWKSNYDSSRKFKPERQNRFPWVKKAVDGSADAHCSLCRANETPRLSNLSNHEKTAKHQRQSNLLTRNRKIPLYNEDERVKEMELQIAVAVTCHSSINAVAHLGKIVVQHGKGSKLEHAVEVTPNEVQSAYYRSALSCFVRRSLCRYGWSKVLCYRR